MIWPPCLAKFYVSIFIFYYGLAEIVRIVIRIFHSSHVRMSR